MDAIAKKRLCACGAPSARCASPASPRRCRSIATRSPSRTSRRAGRFTVDDRAGAADVRETVRPRQWSVALDGASHEVTLLTYDPIRLDVDGRELRASVVDERSLRARGSAARPGTGRFELRAPM